MRNTLTDLHNLLFAQLERLNDDEMSDEQFEKEIKRSTAMEKISANIIANADIALKAKRIALEYGEQQSEVLMLK